MVRRIAAVALLTMLVCSQAMAADINFGSSVVSQGTFKDFSEEFGVALSFRNNLPPHPLGVTGFDAGVEVSAVDINDESGYWDTAFGGDAPSLLVVPRLRVRKGLPFGIDVGAMYSNAGNSNIQLYGVELSKAILDGTAATPALGVRGTYTKLSGVPDVELQTVGIDASVGKGILFLTPYAGAGVLWIDSRPTGNLKTTNPGLSDESIWQPRFFAGVEIKPVPLVRVIAEVEYALRPIYSLKAAVGF
jgi:hypothetical protein